MEKKPVLCFLFSVIGAESYLKPVDLLRVHVHINFTMTSIQYSCGRKTLTARA